jgi:hypothetical protein
MFAAPGEPSLRDPRIQGLPLSFAARLDLLEAIYDLFSAARGVSLIIGVSFRSRRPQSGLTLFSLYVSGKIGIDENLDDASGGDHRKAHDDPHVRVHVRASFLFQL